MDVLEIARWQFAITTVVHYFFVPVTISLSLLVAIMQSIWMRTKDERWLRMTKFFGKVMLINIAVGVVTGLVQEFQFGMNWSDYSRFVGDVFGVPLALEALLAFYLESVFIGVWIFGWGRVPPKVHLAVLWITAAATVASAYFILVANSFMQNPVGYEIDDATGRAELVDIGAVLTNKVALITVPHTIAAAIMLGGGIIAGLAIWHLRKGKRNPELGEPGASSDATVFRNALRVGAVAVLLGGAGTVITGDIQGKVMTEVQPMKMAAAEGLYESQQPAPFSLLTIGTLDGTEPTFQLEVPQLLSWLATGDFDAEVEGINDLQEQYEELYGEGVDYRPNIPVTYWTFRMMITAGVLAMIIAAGMLWMTRRGRVPTGRWVLTAAWAVPILPIAANTFGWIFTEMGRQPWIVFSLMPTSAGVSPSVGAGTVLGSLIAFSVLYAVLVWLWVYLILRHTRPGLPDVSAEAAWGRGATSEGDSGDHDSGDDGPGGGRRPSDEDDADQPLTFAY